MNPRRHGDWITRERRNSLARGEALPDPEPLKPQPVPIVHFGYHNGWKARQERTACGLKSTPYIHKTDLIRHVNCPRCLAARQPVEAR